MKKYHDPRRFRLFNYPTRHVVALGMPYLIDSLEELRGLKVLVFGAGGGGDVLGAYILYQRLRSLGAHPMLGSVVWERYTVDPVPGPIPLEAVEGPTRAWRSIALVDGSIVAFREGRRVKPQLARLLHALGIEGVYLDLSKGEEGIAEAMKIAVEELGFDYIIGLDTGGDALALGCEDGLRSPLADAVSLAGLYRVRDRSSVAILSPGADGELEWMQILRYISHIAHSGGLIGVYGLNRREYNAAHSVSDVVVSEASKIPLRAFSGEYGEARIRGGMRRVTITPVSASMYLLDTVKVYNWTPLPGLVEGTRSIEEARRRLNDRCIYTELDLEEDLYRLKSAQPKRPMTINDIYHEGRRRLFMEGCRAVECR